MSIYLKSTLNAKHLYRIKKTVSSAIKSGNIDNLYYYSIPFGLRKTVFKSFSIPIYLNDYIDKTFCPVENFFLKDICLSLGEKCYNVYLEKVNTYEGVPNWTEFERLEFIIQYLNKRNKDFTIYIDSEFTNNNLRLIHTLLNRFPDVDIRFKLSDLEFSYFQIKSIENDTIYTETKCLFERLELDLPNCYEDNVSFKQIINGKLVTNIDIQRYYKIKDKKLGILSDGTMLPKSISKDSIVILR